MKSNFFIVLFFISVSSCFSQQQVTWIDLSKVKFKEKYVAKYEVDFLYPKFSKSVKLLEGKKITIVGYFLDIHPTEYRYILSKGPMSSCFFCGVGGPETAIELEFSSKQNFKTDDIVSITGILKLNVNDIDRFNYILQECTGEQVE